MENIKIEIEGTKIREAFVEAANDIFKSGYTNPVKKALEEAVEAKQGEIKVVVDAIVADAISNPDFKAKIGEVVISQMVQSALKR